MPISAALYCDVRISVAENFKIKRNFMQPDPLFLQGYVGWASAPGKGRGVMALKDIPAGTVFERCPVAIMPRTDMKDDNGEMLLINNYVFRWGAETAPRKTTHMAAGVGGYGPLYNHSYAPNADLREDHENTLMEFFALRDIAQGEEITIDYDCELWFDYTP
jgi:uncharacterized protein